MPFSYFNDLSLVKLTKSCANLVEVFKYFQDEKKPSPELGPENGFVYFPKGES